VDVFIARRPIFDRMNRVFGYKLVHSSLSEPSSDENSFDSALQLIDNSLLVFDLETLSGGKKLFFTFTNEALDSGCAELLPKAHVVIDLHPSVSEDEKVVAQCRELRSAGYDICAPVFGATDVSKSLVELANLVSLDFQLVADPRIRRMFTFGGFSDKVLLSRSIDSLEDLEAAKKLGCHYFEGEFFSKPPMVASRDLPGLKPNFLRLLRALSDPEPDFGKVADIIAREVSLTYKLLRLVNSAASGLSNRVTSIDRALMLIGARGLRQWAAVIVVAELSSSAPAELICCSAVRGRFCQLIGEALGLTSYAQDLFLMGLFSLLDVIAQRPMPLLLNDLELEGPARDALENGRGDFRPILDLVVAYEQARWDVVAEQGATIGLPLHRLPGLYVPAVEWADVSSGAAAGVAA